MTSRLTRFGDPATGQPMTEQAVETRVRMLRRDDGAHEAVITIARDELVNRRVARDQAQKENTLLRGLIHHRPDWRCTYHYRRHDGSHIRSMGECPHGLPGCACADDLMCAEMDAMQRQSEKEAGKPTLGQTPKWSAIEALTGTAIGFVVALFGQVFMMWLHGVAMSFFNNVLITLFFTGLSIIRGYLVRRFFNYLHHR